MSTPILFERGNIVAVKWLSESFAGVVIEVDHENAVIGGKMNYRVAVIKDGKIESKLWFMNDDLTLLDEGTAK